MLLRFPHEHIRHLIALVVAYTASVFSAFSSVVSGLGALFFATMFILVRCSCNLRSRLVIQTRATLCTRTTIVVLDTVPAAAKSVSDVANAVRHKNAVDAGATAFVIAFRLVKAGLNWHVQS